MKEVIEIVEVWINNNSKALYRCEPVNEWWKFRDLRDLDEVSRTCWEEVCKCLEGKGYYIGGCEGC